MDQNTLSQQTPMVPTPPVQSPTPAIPPSPINPRVIILIVLIIIVALVLGVGVYTLNSSKKQSTSPQPSILPSPKPTVDPTANWKTYTNSVLQFSIRYPSDWNIEEIENKTIILIKSPNVEYQEPVNKVVKGAEIRIQISPYNYSGNISSLIQKPGTVPEADITYISSILVEVSEIESVKTISTGLYGKVVQYQIPKENKIYEIGIYTSDQTIQNTFDQILSTFKFTN